MTPERKAGDDLGIEGQNLLGGPSTTVRSVDHVLGIGNAIVDVIAAADDDFIAGRGLVKGSMRLIDTEESQALYDAMGPGVEGSGGSAANTMAGVASLGGSCTFVGKVAEDDLGRVFTHDLRAAGVQFDTPPATDGLPTARSLILVSPDGQRTMSTYLGCSVDLSPNDLDHDRIASAGITYLEGYLWDPPAAKDAFMATMETAHKAGRRVALTLSDAFCVDRYRDELVALVEGQIDILFGNEDEITSLFQADGFDSALEQAREHCEVVALTRGAKGSVIARGDELVECQAEPVEVVDTTGAGDLFASGVLFGLASGAPLQTCARLGALCAAEVISHVGARPQVSLAALARGVE